MLTGENLVSARYEQTKCVFGRASKPKSHWVYRAPEPETNEEFGTEELIVEVRGNRLCTVFPGSVYVSGEAIAFDDRHDNCQVVDVELFKACLSGPRHELVLCTGAKLTWL